MATPTLPDKHEDAQLETRLARLEEAVDRGRREGRNSGRAFSIFAVTALGLAMVTFIAVVAKLPDSSNQGTAAVRVTGPMMGAGTATTAPPQTTAAPVAAASPRVGVSLAEYTVTPAPTTAKAGKVTFTVRNAGKIGHEFVVLRTAKPAADLLKGSEADETGNVGEIGGIAPGQTKQLSLALKPGHYALICNLPGHYAAGQHADLTVR